MSTILASARPQQAFTTALHRLKPYRLRLIGVLILGLITAVCGLIGPWAVGVVVDKLLVTPDFRQVLGYCLIIVVGGSIAAVGTWWSSVLLARVLEPAIASLRESVLDAALSLDSDTVERAGRGDVVSRVADDSREVSTAASSVLPLVIQAGFTVFVSAIGMTAVDWRLGLIGLIAVPLYWSTLRVYLPRSGPMYTQEREAFGVRTQRLLGAVQGASTLRAYGAEAVELQRINQASGAARDISISVFRFVTWAFSRNNRAECITLIAILGTGFYLVTQDLVTVGAVSTAALIFHRLFGPIGIVVGMFADVQSAAASLTRMVGVIETAQSHSPGTASAPNEATLRLVDVSHAFDGLPVIDGVNLEISPGEHLAVVGATGAGKSTLALIASGLLSPTTGTVLLNDSDIADIAPDQLRSVIAMVSQEMHCFRGTVVDNVRMAKPSASDEEVRAALATVGDAWIARLPDGADTIIGDGGFRLTAVESQFVALARVELADPEIVVLDEATAEAGSEHAQRLEEAARVVVEGRGCLTVAHRLDQAIQADRIIVMESGCIKESGTHEQLRQLGGAYEKLWRAWSA